MGRICWRPLLFVLCLAAPFLLAASGPPANVIRFDYSFWNMLTPAGRERLTAVPIILRETCGGVLQGTVFTGGRYDGAADTITLCGLVVPEERDRIRHEALHALDWSSGFRMTDKNGFGKMVASAAPALAERAEAVYACGPGERQTKAMSACHAWFRPGELWAMLPLIVDWDFEALPDDVAALYAPWFEEAR